MLLSKGMRHTMKIRRYSNGDIIIKIKFIRKEITIIISKKAQ